MTIDRDKVLALIKQARSEYRDSDAAGDVLDWMEERALAQPAEAVEAPWITDLRNEAMRGAMKDVYWLSRDQVFELIGNDAGLKPPAHPDVIVTRSTEAVGGKTTYCLGCEYEAATEAEAAAGECPRCGAGRVAVAAQGAVAFVPGVMHCAKCKFRLVRKNLYVLDGTVGAGDSKTEPCPNGCGPLWPVTWEQEARECWARLEEMAAHPHPTPDTTAAELLGLVEVLPPRPTPNMDYSYEISPKHAEELHARFDALSRTLAGKIKESGT